MLLLARQDRVVYDAVVPRENLRLPQRNRLLTVVRLCAVIGAVALCLSGSSLHTRIVPGRHVTLCRGMKSSSEKVTFCLIL